MAQKFKKESWLVFYRTRSGKLMSKEVSTVYELRLKEDSVPVFKDLLSKEDAMALTEREKGFDHFEIGPSGPIVKRLQYV